MDTDAIPRLEPGSEVGHANNALADWAGTVTVNRAGNWQRRAADNVPEVLAAFDQAAGLVPA